MRRVSANLDLDTIIKLRIDLLPWLLLAQAQKAWLRTYTMFRHYRRARWEDFHWLSLQRSPATKNPLSLISVRLWVCLQPDKVRKRWKMENVEANIRKKQHIFVELTNDLDTGFKFTLCLHFLSPIKAAQMLLWLPSCTSFSLPSPACDKLPGIPWNMTHKIQCHHKPGSIADLWIQLPPCL